MKFLPDAVHSEYQIWGWHDLKKPKGLELKIKKIIIFLDHMNMDADVWLTIQLEFGKNLKETVKPVLARRKQLRGIGFELFGPGSGMRRDWLVSVSLVRKGETLQHRDFHSVAKLLKDVCQALNIHGPRYLKVEHRYAH